MRIISGRFRSSSRHPTGDESKEISTLNVAIGVIDVIKETVDLFPPVKGVLASASILLALIRVSHDLLIHTWPRR